MLTQQDIYPAGSENCPPMLNKDNYVPWSSRLLRYAKSKPNQKSLVNSIKNGPYKDDEITHQEEKQMEADDQAIRTILIGLPNDIYVAVDSFWTAKEIWLCVEQLMKGSTIGAQEKKDKLFNEWENFKSTEEESIESYYHCFSKNYVRQYAGQITWNQNGYNVVQNVKNRAVQNLRVQNVRNQNGLIVVPEIAPLIANHNANQNGNENVIATQAEGNANGNDEEARIQLQAEEFDLMDVAGDIDEIKDVNENYVLMANFQQASTSGTQIGKALIYDLDGTSE
nr:hypothetical protein [Tanacetum cinerariifolium]